MKLRYYAAVMTGCLAEVLSMAAMLIWTDVDLLEITVWALLAYLAAVCAVLWFTEPKQERARRHTEPKIFGIKEDEHER